MHLHIKASFLCKKSICNEAMSWWSCRSVISNQGIVALLTCLSCDRGYICKLNQILQVCSYTSVAYECALSQSITTMQACQVIQKLKTRDGFISSLSNIACWINHIFTGNGSMMFSIVYMSF